MRSFSIVGAFMCVPTCGFGLFFLYNLIEEVLLSPFGWNPSRAEAVLVPLAVAGSFLLPWSVVCLRRATRATNNIPRPAAGRKTAVGLCLILAVVLPFVWNAVRPRLLDPELMDILRQQTQVIQVLDETRSKLANLHDSDTLQRERLVQQRIDFERELMRLEYRERNRPRSSLYPIMEMLLIGLPIGFLALLLLRPGKLASAPKTTAVR